MTFLRPKPFPLEKLFFCLPGVLLSKPFRPRVPGLRSIRFPPGNAILRFRVPRLHSKLFPLKTLFLCSLDALHSKPSPLRMRFILARARDSCLRTASGLRFRMRAISPDFSPS